MAVPGTYSRFEHLITQERIDTKYVVILVVTSDRGMADAHSTTILRGTGHLIEELVKEGKEPVIFTLGRRAQSYFSFQGTPIEFSWIGQSDYPSNEATEKVATTLLDHFLQSVEVGGVTEVHTVFARYVPMISQVPEVRRILPLKVVDVVGAGELDNAGSEAPKKELKAEHGSSMPLYEFEPGPSEVLDVLPARHIDSRTHDALLQSAASELASRQQIIYMATDSVEGLAITYTRLTNAARQGDITQETTETISGADTLGAKQTGESPDIVENPTQTHLTEQDPLSILEDTEEHT